MKQIKLHNVNEFSHNLYLEYVICLAENKVHTLYKVLKQKTSPHIVFKKKCVSLVDCFCLSLLLYVYGYN